MLRTSFPLLSKRRPLLRRSVIGPWRPYPRPRLSLGGARVESAPDLSAIKAGSLIVKRAETAEEVIAAQRLRYQVFYQEKGAKPVKRMARLQRDYDEFDSYSDHLLVVDTAAPFHRRVVGTYRILRLDRARALRRTLYTESEYDLTNLVNTGATVMEVSRSCVAAPYRKRTTVNLLWAGIANYTFHYGIDYVLGVASFDGTSLEPHADALAYLNTNFLADQSIRPRALAHAYSRLPNHALDETRAREVVRGLPPLLKGYLRLGAVIGDGAYVDHQFNTVDVCIIVDMNQADGRYLDHYRRSGSHAD